MAVPNFDRDLQTKGSNQRIPNCYKLGQKKHEDARAPQGSLWYMHSEGTENPSGFHYFLFLFARKPQKFFS